MKNWSREYTPFPRYNFRVITLPEIVDFRLPRIRLFFMFDDR